MNTKIDYIIEDSLLIRKFYGNITIETLAFSVNYIAEKNLIGKNCKGIISDFTNASFLIKAENFPKLKSLFIQHKNILSGLRFAQIITNPQIAQTILFSSENPDLLSQSFSTLGAAKKWILLG